MTRRQIATTMTAATCAIVLAAATPPAWAKAEAASLVQLEKYCMASWRNARIDMQEWSDCTQQTLADLLTRIPREQMTEAIENPESIERRELTRSIWCTVQRMRRARKHIPLEPCMTPGTSADIGSDVESEELRESICSDEAGLSARQKNILMHLLDGYSVSEIAETLKLEPARVSDEKYKAVKKLRRHMVA